MEIKTVEDALKEIDAALKTPRLNRAKESVLYSLRETVRASVGLARDSGRYEKVDQKILSQSLPIHIKQCVEACLQGK